MPNYDRDKDYMKLMQDAAETGDYRAAADYERQRNDKITGEGLNVPQTSKYQAYGDAAKQASSYLQQLQERPKFNYDAASDPLYQQYKQMYMRQGNQAMGDTVGKVAAMTGGYGNSYAQTAGQQIYQQYLDQLNDRVPELYNAAYNRYAQEGADLRDAYSMAANQENLEYNRLLAADQTAYERGQTERDRSYSMAAAMLSGGVMPSSEMLAAAGLSAADAQKLMQAAMSSVGGSGGGGSGGGYYRYRTDNTDTVSPTNGKFDSFASRVGNYSDAMATKAKAEEAARSAAGAKSSDNGSTPAGYVSNNPSANDVYKEAAYAVKIGRDPTEYIASMMFNGSISLDEAYSIAKALGIKFNY